jgi:hypothetical protein
MYRLSVLLFLALSCSTTEKARYNEIEYANFHLRNCAKSEQLEFYLKKSLKDGLRCLEKFQSFSQDVFVLKNIIANHQINILCDDNLKELARANIKEAISRSNYEIQIDNNASEVTNEQYKEGVFFHETLHFLGYKHFENYDLPYIAEYCCFHNNTEACQLLNTPKDQWQTQDYMNSFTKIMNLNKRGFIAAKTALNLEFQNQDKSDHTFGKYLLSYINTNNFEKLKCGSYREIEYIIFSSFLNRDLANDTYLKDCKMEMEKIKFLNEFGVILRRLIGQDEHGIKTHWKNISAKEMKICQNLTKNEKLDLNLILKDFHIYFFDLRDKYKLNIPQDLLVHWGETCSF